MNVFISFVKMQKRLSGFLLLSFVFIAGCGQQSSIDDAITVQTAIQKSFLYSDVFSFIDENPFSSSGVIRESLGLYSNTSSDILSSDVELAITTDSSNANKFSSVLFSGSLEDKIHGDVFNGSGTVYYVSTGTKKYINRQEGYADLGPGNTESFIVRMVLDSIRSQWMLIDDNELINSDLLAPIDGSKVLNILTGIRKIIRQEGLLIPSSSSIAGLYPLTVSNSGYINEQILGLYTAIERKISNVDMSFIGSIQTFPETKLVIQGFENIYDNRHVSGYIGVRNGSLLLKQEDSTRTIDRQERKKSIDLDISMKKNDKESFSLSLIVTPKSITNAIGGLAYEGEMRFALSANNIVAFPIAGLYGIYIVEETQFLEPTRYILMSQLFGDEYGIARILESE